MLGFQIRQDGRPYLDRLRIVQTPWFSVLLHRIHEPDLDRHPHDHPWPFASLILSGSYEERVWDNPADLRSSRIRMHPRFSLKRMKLSQAHRITSLGPQPLWTLVLAGRRRKSWRFWTADGPVDWRNYPGAGERADDNPW
jgi:hypothetical protein